MRAAAAGALAFLLGLGLPATAAALRVGDPAPAFDLPELASGRRLALGDLRGKVAVLHFWASWCPSCVEEMKALEALSGQVTDGGVVPWSINVGEGRQPVESYVRALGLSYTILMDNDSSVARAYGVSGLPMTFILDRSGTIRYKIVGEINREGLRRLLLTIR